MIFSYFCSISSITNWERNSVTRLCLTLVTFCITLVLRLKFQIWFSIGSIFSFHMGKWIFEFFLSNQLLHFQSLNVVYDRNRIFGRNFRQNRPKYSAESFGQLAEYSAKCKTTKMGQNPTFFQLSYQNSIYIDKLFWNFIV